MFDVDAGVASEAQVVLDSMRVSRPATPAPASQQYDHSEVVVGEPGLMHGSHPRTLPLAIDRPLDGSEPALEAVDVTGARAKHQEPRSGSTLPRRSPPARPHACTAASSTCCGVRVPTHGGSLAPEAANIGVGDKPD